LRVVLGSAANAATLLSPAPAFNGRVVRLEHASRPEERQWLVATALVRAAIRTFIAERCVAETVEFRTPVLVAIGYRI
jgi:hypothetical protein